MELGRVSLSPSARTALCSRAGSPRRQCVSMRGRRGDVLPGYGDWNRGKQNNTSDFCLISWVDGGTIRRQGFTCGSKIPCCCDLRKMRSLPWAPVSVDPGGKVPSLLSLHQSSNQGSHWGETRPGHVGSTQPWPWPWPARCPRPGPSHCHSVPGLFSQDTPSRKGLSFLCHLYTGRLNKGSLTCELCAPKTISKSPNPQHFRM